MGAQTSVCFLFQYSTELERINRKSGMSPPVREDGGQPVKSFRGTKKLAENLLFWQTSGILKKIAIGMTS